MGPRSRARTKPIGGVPATRTGHGVCAVVNPGASAMNVHVPVRSPIIAQRPLSSLDEVISGGYASLLTARIVAPFSGLPPVSRIVPVARAACANTDVDNDRHTR